MSLLVALSITTTGCAATTRGKGIQAALFGTGSLLVAGGMASHSLSNDPWIASSDGTLSGHPINTDPNAGVLPMMLGFGMYATAILIGIADHRDYE